jgi:hypothetical protein
MKVCGFTIIRNAVQFDYPVVEAITSILPICDEFIVAVGDSNDETKQLILNIQSPKIKIIDTIWDETNRTNGSILAIETNKAKAAAAIDTDWLFYIQADEVVHEKYLPEIKSKMEQYKADKNVDGLLFKYLHFYGSYDYVGASHKWYANEIRVIKNNPSIYSYKDAQGFRKDHNQKLKVKTIDAFIYHYGWVKPPASMQQKQLHFHKFWHDDNWIDKNVGNADEFDYAQIDQLKKFTENHPAVMQHRIARLNWKFDYDISHNKTTAKELGKKILKKYFGLDFSHKNYEVIK